MIGSRAAKHHFPFFRRPNDYDFIALKPEVDDFLSNFEWVDEGSTHKKIKARIKLDTPTLFEFELAHEHGSSADLLYYNKAESVYHKDDKLGLIYKVASPETLFLLKRSHICFNIHWNKSISDFLFLKRRVDECKMDNDWQSLFHLRFEEVKDRIKYKERNFNVSNSDFFKASEKMVNRIIYHDNIHYATCFFNHPLFVDVKDDLSKAEISQIKINALSHELKIKLIQEECMALAIERYILPCVNNKKQFNARKAYVDTAGRMVYNYLPMFMRLFAADNFTEILDLKVNYVKKFFENAKGLNLSNENMQFAKTAVGLLPDMPAMSV